jgi:hypothetical protein
VTGGAGPDVGVFQDFRRRRVVRVVVAYLAFALGALSAGDLLLHLAAAPDWGFRALLGVLALGFPFVVVLAWTYDLTPDGIERTPEELPDTPPLDLLPRWIWWALVLGGFMAAVVSRIGHMLVA